MLLRQHPFLWKFVLFCGIITAKPTLPAVEFSPFNRWCVYFVLSGRYTDSERRNRMDQIKIGRFIAECRKKKNLTQVQLAEKLNITDRAVSKWETGKSMPDSSVMLGLCSILEISVNDLLSGEVITMNDYNKEAEKNMLEIIRQKEQSDRNLLRIEWVVGILALIVLFIPIIIASVLPMEEWQRTVLIFAGFIPCLVGWGFALKIEQIAGYYECKACGHRYVPTFKAVNLAMHMGRTRYLRCPKCGKRTWQKKVISKEP